MEFDNFAGTGDQGKLVRDDMRRVRVSDASRAAAHGGSAPLTELSLGGLQEERERLVARKRVVEQSICEINDLFSSEQARIRREHGHRNTQKSITAWQARKEELQRERQEVIREKNQLEQELLALKHQLKRLSGSSNLATKHDGIKGGFLDLGQMEQYTEGLRVVIRDELGLLLELRPVLRLLRDQRKEQLKLISHEYQGPDGLLRLAYDLLRSMGERLGWESVRPEDREVMGRIHKHLKYAKRAEPEDQ